MRNRTNRLVSPLVGLEQSNARVGECVFYRDFRGQGQAL